MTIVISEHASLKIHRICFSGTLSVDQLRRMIALHEEHPRWAVADSIHIIEPTTDLSQITDDHIDAVRDRYRALYASLAFYLVRRSVWVCRIPEAWRMVEHYLRDRHSRDGQSAEVMLVADLRDSGDIFANDEIDGLGDTTAFRELARIEA